MTNIEIVKLLRNVAAAYAIKDEKKFKFQIIAYQKAADALESIHTEVKDLLREKKLDSVPGFGPSIRAHIEELMSTGKVKRFEEVMNDVPAAVFPLLEVPSFGPKKAYKLVTFFKFSDPNTVIADLKRKAEANEIADIESFGDKSQSDILRALQEFETGLAKNVRMNLPVAYELAERMLAYLKQSKDVIEVQPLGSLRRRRDTIGDIDIAVATHNPKAVLDYFTAYPSKERILESGDITAAILVSGGKHIDLMVQPPEHFGSLLQHFTGSKNHNVHLREYALKKGLSLSEKGIKEIKTGNMQIFATEEEFYQALGMDWIPPELREDTGEIELALQKQLPKIVELSDMKGDFHLHSSFPIEPSHDMGKDSMEEMLKKAKELNYSYLGFSEHNPSISKHTPEQVYQTLEKRSKEIEQLNLKNKNSIQAFRLLETDILPNGSLAIDEKSTKFLDAMLVSIHSVFSMDKETMTKRVLKGLSHPKAKILTHPTGRLINQRQGYDLDWEQLFEFAAKHNKAIEINAFPSRLDLPDALVREAIRKGVRLVIDTDSHAKDQMDLMRHGVSVARRGWATKHDILNTMPYNEIAEWFRS